MKKFITVFCLIALFAVSSVQSQCCKKATQPGSCASETAVVKSTENLGIEAYYFHFTRRCVTCQAVEQVSADALKELYGSKIVLKSINLDEKENSELAKKLGIEGQSLLFVKGAKKVDLIKDGFMYARTNPNKLKEKIKATVDSMK